MRLRHRAFGTACAGAVAAALLVAAVGFGSIGDIARANPAEGPARQKKAPPAKGPVQPLRKGADRHVRACPGRAGIPRGQPLGPNALPQNARTAPPVIAIRISRACARRAANRRARARSARARTPVRPTPGRTPNSGKSPIRMPRLRRQSSRAIAPFGNQPGNRAFGNNRPGELPARQPQSAARLHPSRPAHARRQRRDAADAAGAALHPSRRDVRDPRPDAALSPARRAQLHRHAAGQRNALRHRPKWSASGDPTSRRSGSRRSRASTI